MYSNTGYIIYNTDIDYQDNENPLSVKSCGIYRLLHQPVLQCSRPKGRLDYQLIYVASGRAFFYMNHQEVEAKVGSMILYRPGEPQIYHYNVEDTPEICWVHFSGYEVEELLNRIGFFGTSIVRCGTTFNYQKVFRQMIRELQLQRPCFEEMLPLYLKQIMTGICRSQMEQLENPYKNLKELEKTIDYFNENYASDIVIADYAKEHHMSTCWFIRSFKNYLNMTPMQYITSIRINKAKELLTCTEYSIKEISFIVGYENPLYFSRIFKKTTGHSPSQYRTLGND